MNKNCNQTAIKREELLTICMDRGMSLDEILKISKRFIDKTDKEKEALADEILKTL